MGKIQNMLLMFAALSNSMYNDTNGNNPVGSNDEFARLVRSAYHETLFEEYYLITIKKSNHSATRRNMIESEALRRLQAVPQRQDILDKIKEFHESNK